MKILGIDPGTKEFGVVIWYPDTPKIFHTTFQPGDALEYFREIAAGKEIINYIGIEMIGHYGTGMPAGKDVYDTCLLIGRTQEILKSNRPLLIYRYEVKSHFCRSARAKDGNIRQALIDRFGAPGTKKAPGLLYKVKEHEWQALAVAVYVWDQVKEEKQKCG